MRVKLLDSFIRKLNHQIAYIARDKPTAARRFKNDVLAILSDLANWPYKGKPSIYFNSPAFRDLTFKGYTIVYNVNEQAQEIIVVGFIKYEDGF